MDVASNLYAIDNNFGTHNKNLTEKEIVEYLRCYQTDSDTGYLLLSINFDDKAVTEIFDIVNLQMSLDDLSRNIISDVTGSVDVDSEGTHITFHLRSNTFKDGLNNTILFTVKVI